MRTFKEFLNTVDETYYRHSFEWRYGQTVMNVLRDIWFDKYNELTASQYDCFYDDGMTKTTLELLEQTWNQ